MLEKQRQAGTFLAAPLLLLFLPATASSAETDFAARAAPLLGRYCSECHGSELAEAQINLQQMAASPDFGRRFKIWEKVLGMLRQERMPPEPMPQPSRAERKMLIGAIRGGLDSFIKANAGDPGPVVMRRLTSAEYAYTIQDLTGLDLPLERGFINDAVGGEGFTNVGRAQFMQDSALERYLEAARNIASHAVIGSGPLDFCEDPGQTGLELSAIKRIQRIYRRHGFRAGAGEGAEPFGLDRYPRAFYVAWQYRHREALGLGQTTLEKLAETEGLSARFTRHIWTVLNEADASFPISVIATEWRALPTPSGGTDKLEEEVRAGCEDLYRVMRNWQSVLAAATGDEEEAAILRQDALDVGPTHSFQADLDWPKNATAATIELSVTMASDKVAAGSIVLWKNARIRFRREDKRWLAFRPLGEALTANSRRRLRFGRHPDGADLDDSDFAFSAPRDVSVQLVIPESATEAELRVEVELDRQHGAGAPVRCTISDGAVEGETIAESGGHSALLVDPDSASSETWKRGVLEFARKLPEVSHREPAPSDRDPIPAPFDNTYNSTERNLFHYRIKYHRDDDFLVKHVLDDPTRRRLDRAWTDLLNSFEYHDAYLRFVADKYDLDLLGRGIAELDRKRIARLPEEPRRFVQRLHESYVSGRRRLRAAEPGHVDDALRFAERAWRRPLTEQEKNRLRSFYKQLRSDPADRLFRESRAAASDNASSAAASGIGRGASGAGLDHTETMRALLARILVSPAFLYRVEPPAGKRGIVPLSDWELANRLSYFLWSSVPDDELRRAAAAGRLHDAGELARQARRMLRDRKARRFAAEFFGQWFGFYRFDDYRGIDSGRFPEFTDSLKASMYDEAVSFFEHIVRRDRPVGEILFADYSFLNRQLAQHYGIDRPQETSTSSGSQTRLVEGVDRRHRGGLLRLGAVLTVTSAPLRTSPVKRGDWVLRRVLGTPVPPPPPDAGSIPADDVTADGRTVRERLVAHRRDASCVNCHSRIDPLGFALENFDAIGRWRDRYRDGQPIETGGTLSDGTEIAGPVGLRQYLQKNEKQFRRTLCSKLLGYALGRAEIVSDRPLIDRMMADLEGDGRFSQLVVRIVTSRQFRHQRTGPVEEPERRSTKSETKPKSE